MDLASHGKQGRMRSLLSAPDKTRTCDFLLRRQALYPLSYRRNSLIGLIMTQKPILGKGFSRLARNDEAQQEAGAGQRGKDQISGWITCMKAALMPASVSAGKPTNF